MRARALGKSQPTEGTRWGHWCMLECKVSFNVLYRLKIENIRCELIRALKIGNLDFWIL